MQPALRIREASSSDLPEVRELLLATWRDTYDGLLGRARVDEISGRWHAVDALAQQLGWPNASFLVAEKDGQIVGHAFAALREPPKLDLARLYVLPTEQRRGVGVSLLAAIIDRHPGAVSVRLTVEAGNPKGVAFYRREGFAMTGEAMEYGVSVLRMEKAIDRRGRKLT